ncbi:MAG: DUF4062 domain-containing protein, partial [Gammaproteobacteria bacterium]|nr:DUF4062 domain-containing protein [Gammaproteobacteria bacterium]
MKPVFRVFVSSTFSDMKHERDALQRGAFPNVARYCEEIGAKFQAIDLRWGVSSEASLDQRAMDICLSELQRCQRASPKPNFIMLLGDRYGTCLAPYKIDAEELEFLSQYISKEENELVRQWYKLDGNNIPPAYFLRSREGEFVKDEIWQEVEQSLRKNLLKALEQSDWAVDDPRRAKYTHSATHQEILHGALDQRSDLGRVLMYHRKILSSPTGKSRNEYLDLTPTGAINQEAKKKLLKLIDNLKARLPPHNIHVFDSIWDLDKPRYDLSQFSREVERDLIEIIDAEIARREAAGAIHLERSLHENFAQSRGQHYVSQHHIQQKLERYLTLESSTPLAVTGEPGIGKTAAMANLAGFARSHGNISIVVERYVGASPASSDIFSLMKGVYLELAELFQRDEAVAASSPIAVMQQIIELADSNGNKNIALMIDAIDQLKDSHLPEATSWVPKKLPKNLKVLVSTLERQDDQSGKALERIRDHIEANNIVRLDKLSEESIPTLISKLLKDQNRTLNEEQLKVLSQRAGRSGLPLYLKLATDIALRWRSHEESALTCGALPESIEELILFRFDMLSNDENHGKIFVANALGFLAASTKGLSEIELQAMLSSNTATFEEFTATSLVPPSKYALDLQKIPITLPLRFIADLEGYLCEVEADGEQVIAFYHRLVRETAVKRYLGPNHHLEIANYFNRLPNFFDTSPHLRKLTEQPAQHRLALDGSGSYLLLSNRDYFEAMLAADRLDASFLELALSYDTFNNIFEDVEKQSIVSNAIDFLIEKSDSFAHSSIVDEIHQLLVYRGYEFFYTDFLKQGSKIELPSRLKPIGIKFKRSYGDSIRRKGMLSEAYDIFVKLLADLEEDFQPTPDSYKILSVLQYDLGYIDYLRGNNESSGGWMEKSAENARQAENWFGYWHTLGAKTMHRYRAKKDNYEEIISFNRDALAYFESVDDERHRRGMFNALAHSFDAHYGHKEIDAAKNTFDLLINSSWVAESNHEHTLKRYRALMASLLGQHANAAQFMQ